MYEKVSINNKDLLVNRTSSKCIKKVLERRELLVNIRRNINK